MAYHYTPSLQRRHSVGVPWNCHGALVMEYWQGRDEMGPSTVAWVLFPVLIWPW